MACLGHLITLSPSRWQYNSGLFVCLLATETRQAVSGGPSITSCSFKMAGDESGATLGQPHLARQDLNSLVSLDFLYLLWSFFLTCPRRIVVFLLNVAVQRP